MDGIQIESLPNGEFDNAAINKFRIDGAPSTVYYIPNFVSKLEEATLLEKVYKVPKPKWTQLSNRRLQNWGGIPHPNGMLVEKIPEWLSFYLDKVWNLGVFEKLIKPNHVLINEYLSGQGIMPHFDGPLFYPTITTLSLGSHTVLDFYLPRSEESRGSQAEEKSKQFSLFVEPRSLLILKGEMYTRYLHGIEETDWDPVSSDNISNWNYCETLRNSSQENILTVESESHNSPSNPVDYPFKVDNQGVEGLSVDCDKAAVKDNIVDELGRNKIIRTLHRKTRVSLTMRHVPKTSKVKIKLGR
ncbi:alpha-ketoglutarate-dependent dioxygenase alkB homolog 6 [Ischnura elegans]|uniref:alpha-ketoglutarate-dependent dioxygenase alkB homolog 6 n=1 Tax=Ischnura elegans TaxID=197161 RepID=UPI001ED8892B|nr:alpha-ketoglutarate-dependent dioxygenase alkB homolog 6 [Ischnura elegans]